MYPMYFTKALNLARLALSETIHGIPMCRATPFPANGTVPTGTSFLGKRTVKGRLGGSNALAGWARYELLDLTEDVDILRPGRAMDTGGGRLEWDEPEGDLMLCFDGDDSDVLNVGSLVGDDVSEDDGPEASRPDESEPSRRISGSIAGMRVSESRGVRASVPSVEDEAERTEGWETPIGRAGARLVPRLGGGCWDRAEAVDLCEVVRSLSADLPDSLAFAACVTRGIARDVG